MADKARNGDGAALALLKWALGALLLVNGAAFGLAAAQHGIDATLWRGPARYYAAGLLCALGGGISWAFAYGATFPGNGGYDPRDIPPARLGSYDRATALGAIAIMLWVASLATFVLGCQHATWLPDESRGKAVHQPQPPAPPER